MARHDGGIFSKPIGSVGDVTFQRGRSRRKSAVQSREKPVPFQPHTTAQDLQQDKLRTAVALIALLPANNYKPAWNAARPNRSANQVLLSFLLRALVHNGSDWTLDADVPAPALGPSYLPPGTSTGSWGPHQAIIRHDTDYYGDHAGPDDRMYGIIFPQTDPLNPAAIPLPPHLLEYPRSSIPHVIYPLILHVLYWGVFWYQHPEPNGTFTSSQSVIHAFMPGP